MEKNMEVRMQNKEERFTAETQRRGEICPSTRSGRTAFFPVMLSLSKHLLILCTVLLITSCGGGGGNNDTNPTSPTSSTTTPTSTITFSGLGGGTNNVYMSHNISLSSGDVIAIDVKASGISGNAKGAAFDVDFDSSKLTYTDKVDGDFFGAGSTTNVALQQGTTNKVVVGVATSSGTVTGSGTIVTLKFKATGNSVVDFSNAALKDLSLNTITATWTGGTVTVK